jgi:hypothetical protein
MDESRDEKNTQGTPGAGENADTASGGSPDGNETDAADAVEGHGIDKPVTTDD